MEVTLQFADKKTFNRFMRNMQNGKGTVISPDNVSFSGEGFLDTMKSGLKSIAKSDIGKELIKKGMDAGMTAVKSGLISRGAPPSLVNAIGDEGNKLAKKEVMKQVDGMGFLDSMKRAVKSDIGKAITKTVVNEGFKQANKKLAEKGFSNDLTKGISSALQNETNKQISGMGTGKGRKKKLVKGSQEAKDHMARLREMRKNRGGSIIALDGRY
jgi:hypothetical protein